MELARPDHVQSHNNMKYSEACKLKALIDQAITNLERKVIEGSITATGRKRLIAALVSHPFSNPE